jgi:hypothetical protein
MENSAQTQLYDLLVTKDFEPEIKDASGKDVTDPAQAEMFTFDWKTPTKNYGTVVLLMGDNNDLQVFFGNNLGQNMEPGDKMKWYDFLEQLKQFSVRNRFERFTPQNINRLKYTMQGMSAIKEGLFEGYYGNKKYSYSDQPKQVKLVIKHDRPLGESDKRYRNIESIFVETGAGERFKVPSRSLMHGKMLARHIAEGGNPYDTFGQHIGQIINELATLAKFIRASKNKSFNGAAKDLCETAFLHYQDLKDKAKRIISQRGYRRELEGYDPANISKSEIMVDDLREMFIEQSLDSRIEEALPILAKLAEHFETSMKEASEFDKWATNVVEGTWATPDTPEAKKELADFLSKPFPVGPDATNATEILYSIFGDDKLFDQLADLAAQDPDADSRELVQNRLEELGIDIAVPAADIAAPPEPTDANTPPEDTAPVGEPPLPEEPPVDENLDVDGVMRTVPSNMSNESVERILRLAQLLK